MTGHDEYQEANVGGPSAKAPAGSTVRVLGAELFESAPYEFKLRAIRTLALTFEATLDEAISKLTELERAMVGRRTKLPAAYVRATRIAVAHTKKQFRNGVAGLMARALQGSVAALSALPQEFLAAEPLLDNINDRISTLVDITTASPDARANPIADDLLAGIKTELTKANWALASVHYLSYAVLKDVKSKPYMVEPKGHEFSDEVPPTSEYDSEAVYLAAIAVEAVRLAEQESSLDRAIRLARESGASWASIGRAVGITPQAAYRRWDPSGKAKHREYRSERRKAPTTGDN